MSDLRLRPDWHLFRADVYKGCGWVSIGFRQMMSLLGGDPAQLS